MSRYPKTCPPLSRSILLLIFAVLIISQLTVFIPETQGADQTDPPPADPQFPLYPEIRPNVEFWIRIFARVRADQGLLHDTEDLSIIYGAIRLEKGDSYQIRKKTGRSKKKPFKSIKIYFLHLPAANPRKHRMKRKSPGFSAQTPRKRITKKLPFESGVRPA